MNKVGIYSQAVDITKAVAQGHQNPAVVLKEIYEALKEIATDAEKQ